MRVLLVHNFVGSSAPSGENMVFEAERMLLIKNGHEVDLFTRHSDEIRNRGIVGAVTGALSTSWNPWMVNGIRRRVAQFRPDVVHVHNTFPLISPAIFSAIGPLVPRILTLHNYRLFCPAAIPMRKGAVCTSCLDSLSVIPSLLHGCYRQSRLATAPLALCVALHRILGTWRNEVEGFIALSEFQRNRMAISGLPAGRVHVKPNFFPGQPRTVPWGLRGAYVVYVGRLSVEKGVETLLRAWASWGANAPELRLVGEGPLGSRLRKMASGLPLRFLGILPALDAQAQIANARLLLLPSECFEGFPLVLCEAFAYGTPVAVSNLGALPSIVTHGKNGIIFAPGSPDSLLGQLRMAWETPGFLEQMALAARNEFESRYTEEANYSRLMEIYSHAKNTLYDRIG